MKKRVLSAIAGLILLAVLLAFFDTILVNVLAAWVCLLSLYEIFKAAGLLRFRTLVAVCGLYCILILFLNTSAIAVSFSYLSYLMVVLLFLMLLQSHNELRVEQMAYSFLISILLAVSFYCIILLKEQTGPQMGVFYLLLIFGSAWWSDSGAFFVGTFFGKHKLCPQVSPKKTVEGLIGGLVTSTVCNVLVALAFQALCNWVVPWGYIRNAVTVNLPAVALVTPVASLLGVLGDLSASIIKRQCSIKDFGNLMPGHGGAMDRFDSVLFIGPLFYFIFNICPLISAI